MLPFLIVASAVSLTAGILIGLGVSHEPLTPLPVSQRLDYGELSKPQFPAVNKPLHFFIDKKTGKAYRLSDWDSRGLARKVTPLDSVYLDTDGGEYDLILDSSAIPESGATTEQLLQGNVSRTPSPQATGRVLIPMP